MLTPAWATSVRPGGGCLSSTLRGKNREGLIKQIHSDCKFRCAPSAAGDLRRLGNFSKSPGEIIGFLEWGSGVSLRRSLKVDLLFTFAVGDIWGFLP